MIEPVAYYYRPWRLWVLYWVDGEGNQLWDCEYMTKADLLDALGL